MSNDADCFNTEHTQKYVLARQTLFIAINPHDVVDIGLEPFLRDVQIRDIAIHRRLSVYIRYLVAGPQLERMGTTDSLSEWPVRFIEHEISSIKGGWSQSGCTYAEENNPWTRSKPRCAALRLSWR